MGFIQSPPRLGNQYDDDRVLRGYLARTLSEEELHSSSGSLARMGELAAGELHAAQLAEREIEPALVQWDPWGNRID